MSLPKLHIALAFDENYLIPFYVVLASIFLNNKGTEIHLHVIATGISNTDKEKIRNYVSQNEARIFFYEINSNLLLKFTAAKNSQYLTVAAYYRLFFPQLVPLDIAKLVYIDVDTVIIGNLLELQNVEIGSKPVGAAVDLGVSWARPSLGIDEEGIYFNSGVLLINLAEWRRQEISEKAIHFTLANPEKIKFADQDALNAVIHDNYYQLSSKFNLATGNIPINLMKKDYEDFVKDKIIIHYTGPYKPGHPLCSNKLRHIYFSYLKLIPKIDPRKNNGFEFSKDFLREFIKIRINEFFINQPRLNRLKKGIHPGQFQSIN